MLIPTMHQWHSAYRCFQKSLGMCRYLPNKSTWTKIKRSEDTFPQPSCTHDQLLLSEVHHHFQVLSCSTASLEKSDGQERLISPLCWEWKRPTQSTAVSITMFEIICSSRIICKSTCVHSTHPEEGANPAPASICSQTTSTHPFPSPSKCKPQLRQKE